MNFSSSVLFNDASFETTLLKFSIRASAMVNILVVAKKARKISSGMKNSDNYF